MSILYLCCLYVVLYDNVHGCPKEFGILLRIVVTNNYFLWRDAFKNYQSRLICKFSQGQHFLLKENAQLCAVDDKRGITVPSTVPTLLLFYCYCVPIVPWLFLLLQKSLQYLLFLLFDPFKLCYCSHSIYYSYYFHFLSFATVPTVPNISDTSRKSNTLTLVLSFFYLEKMVTIYV